MNHENEGVVIGDNGLHKQTLMQRGNKYYQSRQYQEALDAYEEVIHLDSRDEAAYVGKGDCLRKLGHHEQAYLTCGQSLAINLNNISALIGSRYASLELEEYQRASHIYRKALQLDPHNASAQNIAVQILYF